MIGMVGGSTSMSKSAMRLPLHLMSDGQGHGGTVQPLLELRILSADAILALISYHLCWSPWDGQGPAGITYTRRRLRELE